MTIKTVLDIFSQPFGMARLLEGVSTLRRAKAADMTDEQIRAVFPDTAKYSSVQLDAFVQISGDLIDGKTRIKGNAFPHTRSSPQPA